MPKLAVNVAVHHIKKEEKGKTAHKIYFYFPAKSFKFSKYFLRDQKKRKQVNKDDWYIRWESKCNVYIYFFISNIIKMWNILSGGEVKIERSDDLGTEYEDGKILFFFQNLQFNIQKAKSLLLNFHEYTTLANR